MVDIPEWAIKPMVLVVLIYRRLRYGYAFRKIPLTQGKFAIVDSDDYERISLNKWIFKPKGAFGGYAQRGQRTDGKRTTVMMHREILQVADNLVVDHINHNGVDNRKANLRPATTLQNTWNNLRKRGKNRFRGVLWNKAEKKWKVQLACKNRKVNVGTFDDEIAAARAYDEAAKKLRGGFAVLNFPDER